MVKARVQPEPLANDGDEHINRNGDPNLSLHGVLAGAIESLDAEVLLDPLEEQFYLPTAFVDLSVTGATTLPRPSR